MRNCFGPRVIPLTQVEQLDALRKANAQLRQENRQLNELLARAVLQVSYYERNYVPRSSITLNGSRAVEHL